MDERSAHPLGRPMSTMTVGMCAGASNVPIMGDPDDFFDAFFLQELIDLSANGLHGVSFEVRGLHRVPVAGQVRNDEAVALLAEELNLVAPVVRRAREAVQEQQSGFSRRRDRDLHVAVLSPIAEGDLLRDRWKS